MCGIIGVIANRPVTPELIDGLRRLEYRGYDSAGVATLINGHIERRRAEGKSSNLLARLESEPLPGTIGIGHTRWATHGLPTERNAHPIATDRVAVVHNGIIENCQELKRELTALGYSFASDTDTEVVAVLATHFLHEGLAAADTVAKTLTQLKGAFALVFLFAGEHDLLICARRGSHLAIGYGDGEMFVGSDALALAPLTRRISYLEEGDWALITSRQVKIFNSENHAVARAVNETSLSAAPIAKGNYRHFKESPPCTGQLFVAGALGRVHREAARPVEHMLEFTMASVDLSRLAWYERASASLRKYLAELEACQAAVNRGPDPHEPTQHLIDLVKRRLAELDELIDAAVRGAKPTAASKQPESSGPAR
jgi:glutamine amidotransferase-like protein